MSTESNLRDALTSTPATTHDHPVIVAARTVHAADGFHFTRPADQDPPGLGALEAEWGRRVRIHLARSENPS